MTEIISMIVDRDTPPSLDGDVVVDWDLVGNTITWRMLNDWTGAQPPAAQTEDLAGAVWDGPNTASQVDPCMGLPSNR